MKGILFLKFFIPLISPVGCLVLKKLDRKVAIVAGAARGIGKAIAVLLC